jgi:hypothetical protein
VGEVVRYYDRYIHTCRQNYYNYGKKRINHMRNYGFKKLIDGRNHYMRTLKKLIRKKRKNLKIIRENGFNKLLI